MGIYDRDYYQDDDASRGFHFGGQRMMVTNLVLVTIAIFIVDTLLSGKISSQLELHFDFYRRPWQFYQLLTYGFVHAGPWHVGLNMFMLWMFGRVIEDQLGRIEFLLFYLVAIIVAGAACVAYGIAVPAARSTVVVGASGGVNAVFIMFVLYYPKQTIYLWGLIGMPAWVLGAFVIGVDMIRGVSGAEDVTAWQAHLGGALFAFLYLKFRWNFSRMLPAGSRSWKLPRRRPKLRIHDPDEDDLAAEADRILAKVHREGEQSLTSRERRTLERYSRRVRDQRGPR